MRFASSRLLFLSLLLIPTWVLGAPTAEEWKGTPYTNQFNVGGMGGVGILDGTAGFELRGTAAVQVIHHGFLGDINDQVYLEAQPGVLFLLGTSAFTYSLHLRWDFNKNENWTFYALGGFGGSVTGATLGSRAEFYPRFGIGVLWNVFEHLGFRLEVSHEFTGVGVMVLL